MKFKQLNNLMGWAVFAVAAIVYALTAEPTGSLWDCGEFVSGASKLQVVHPPGAPFFLLVGRLFIWVTSLISKDPANIAYAVNLLSGVCTALACMFTAWATSVFARLALLGRNEEPTGGAAVAVVGAGLMAGLAGAFATSIWFSAVEGEVYAMSLMFTAMVIWAMVKWYQLPDAPQHDRWMIFTAYMVGLSIGVHLLSLLTFPGLALLYYFKKNEKPTLRGFLIAGAAGVALLAFVQVGVMQLLTSIGGNFDYFFVDYISLPVGSGLLAFIALIIGGIVWGLRQAQQRGNVILERSLLSFAFILLGFSTYTMIVIRANANTPINMNNPSDPFTLLSYISREQYGARPLLYGPHYAAQPTGVKSADKYGLINGKYEVVDKKLDYEYKEEDMMLFPRIGHADRVQEHEMWRGKERSGTAPTQLDNISFFINYQLMWEYWRYFMWDFAGRQNGNQGYFSADPTDGNWLSGIGFIDGMRLYDQSILPDRMRNEQSRNTYYFLPFLFGFLGLIWHFYRRTTDAWVVFSLFIMLGIAIILYSNQPPNEPRERDYAIAGSILMFAVWIGMGVTALYDIFTRKTKIGSLPAGLLAVGLVATAPLVMLTQNWDDHSRAGHYASRDYASNFLNSCQPNAIIFTYGDNDTYPLWYAQEVENIRTDVRVVNLSLLAVDWYIDQLRRKMNQSPAIAMTIPSAQYRGNKRNQIYHYAPSGDQPMSIQDAVKFMANDHPLQGSEQEIETYLPSNNLFIPVDSAAARKSGAVFAKDSTVAQINFKITKPAIYKDEMAILDILASNLWSRPIYFAVTCTPDKLLGLGEYLQMEGMALRVVPIKSKGRAEFGGMLGGGRVATNIMYDNVMNKFKWGGAFNTKRTFIDKSYFPSVVSIRIAMLRLADELLAQGDADRAVKVVDKYFEAFPNYNFQYDNYTAYFLRIYADAAGLGDASNSIVQANPALKAKLEQFDGKAATLDKFKKQLEVLATEISTMRKFYANPAVAMYYNNDLKQIDGETRGNQVRMGLRDQIIQMADDTRDAAYAQKIKAMFGK